MQLEPLLSPVVSADIARRMHVVNTLGTIPIHAGVRRLASGHVLDKF